MNILMNIPYGTWDNVQGTTIIIQTSYQTTIHLETNQVHLRSGTICPYTDTTYMEDIPSGKPYKKPQWTIVNLITTKDSSLRRIC